MGSAPTEVALGRESAAKEVAGGIDAGRAALKDLLAMYGPPCLARLKIMCELALQQCIRSLASGLVFQPGRDEIRAARS